MGKPVDTHRKFKFSARDLYLLYLYIGFLLIGLFSLPNNIIHGETGRILLTLGVLGIWRYSWWLTHFVRAQIYARFVYPEISRQAKKLWDDGWRPECVHFMITTFREKRDTTERVLRTIIHECRTSGAPVRIYIGTGDESDEKIIEEYLELFAADVDLEAVFVRQNQPGKRFAIGVALRSMSRHGVSPDDPVIFMDGDSIIEPGLFSKCLPLFALFPEVDALTTDEKAVVMGPRAVQLWLDLRFAQRHIGMQSWALSKRLMALTGRLSIFRAANVITESFIRTIESDHLNHWLWGSFRFLSGDDKSTWYWLLRKGSPVLYVPDALVYTVEYIEGNAFERVKQNVLRWNGNTLRNGWRAIALGPHQVGLFIWWCIVDQRISMWTTLVGPILGLMLALRGPQYLVAYLLWVLTTRLFLSILVGYHAGRFHPAFPIILYLNQTATALIKIYMVFRLPKQRWAHRGDQRVAQGDTFLAKFQNFMAIYLTGLYALLLILAAALYAGVIMPPTWITFKHLFGMGSTLLMPVIGPTSSP